MSVATTSIRLSPSSSYSIVEKRPKRDLYGYSIYTGYGIRASNSNHRICCLHYYQAVCKGNSVFPVGF